MSADIRALAAAARQASQQLSSATEEQRDNALAAISRALQENEERIVTANAQDIAEAEKLVASGELGEPLLKRLSLGGSKFIGVIDMVESVASQPDPLGATQSAVELDKDLNLFCISVPIGVIGVIFESRPDALVQIATLCLKSGNAILLKGGSEASRSNRVLADLIAAATDGMEGIPSGWIALLEGREEVRALLDLDQDVDLIIPRGSNEFVQYIMNNTRIPVMGHADGICHVYVDSGADIDKAVRVAVDSKTQYVAVCNAAESLLVHADIAAPFLAAAIPALQTQNVELRGDERVRELAGGDLQPATEEDWHTEYLDLIYSIKIVDNLEEAVAHINHYGSHHTDAILTEDRQAALQFLRTVDSSSVMHNASTRFADGFKYGLGAEVGVSTNRLHSRGPVGLEGLTIYKYILEGDGQIVDTYDGPEHRPFTHRRLDTIWPD
ncbi:MAG: glutamate-5-semialdehyde dehydrogenase [Gemmatimonadetes bacterium]|jgi:glutamate-5-semialdehyde dehydrogenase|nr:glutamate-5-semialdehyde dehydrogenase [Gemmatimonadota bacterium]